MDEKRKTQNGGWNWISMETEVGSNSVAKKRALVHFQIFE